MTCFHILPEEYEEIKKFSFNENKKFSLLVNLAALAVAAFLVIVMQFFVPFDLFTPASDGEVKLVFIKSAVLCALIIAYVFLHEAVHGVCIRIISGKWGGFGFKSGFAYASSAAFFGKYEYIIIALAPVVFWGVVLGIVNVLVPAGWFWVVYAVQVFNLSGAVGDIYMVYSIKDLPKESIFRDDGLNTTVFAKTVVSDGKE